ncbi:Nucleolin 1 [Cardamine amara subsp. amara]
MQIQKSNDTDADLHKPYVPLKDRIFKDISVEGFDTCSLPMFRLQLSLKKHFASCGKIVSIWVIKSVAFIRFEGEGAQENALKLDGTDVEGWKAIVKAAVRPFGYKFPSDDEIEPSTLFVSGYDTALAEIDIQIALCDLFSSCGVVSGVSVTPDGTAILSLGGEGCVEKALELSGRQVGGMNLLVETGLRETEIPENRRLYDDNTCGYVLGTYSRLLAKRRKEEMEKEKKKEREMKREMKMKVMMEKKKEREMKREVKMEKKKEKEKENENEKKKKKKALF